MLMSACCILLFAVRVPTPAEQLEPFLNAVWYVESRYGADARDGDNGLSIGEYQIQAEYVADVNRFLGKRVYTHADARDRYKARHMVAVYVTHWARAKGLMQCPETWARLHNGGPNGCKKKATDEYWNCVQEAMTQCQP